MEVGKGDKLTCMVSPIEDPYTQSLIKVLQRGQSHLMHVDRLGNEADELAITRIHRLVPSHNTHALVGRGYQSEAD